jgi:undecaprenyl-diphosphatase
VDRTVFVWVVEHRVAALSPIFLALSVLGYAGLLWIALAPLAAKRAGLPLTRTVAATAAAVWSADLVTLLIKTIADRPRPFAVVEEADPLLGGTVASSFPSGHAATSFAGAVVLSYVLPRAAPAFVALALAVSFSRVYVGVHYPGDVLAGALIGCAFAVLGVLLLRAPRSPSRIRRRSEALRRAG